MDIQKTKTKVVSPIHGRSFNPSKGTSHRKQWRNIP